ncbi:MAG: hypothetical protein CVU79_01680, partial [Elusimicrobia bacterium HGW-Elusimicrobia-3]
MKPSVRGGRQRGPQAVFQQFQVGPGALLHLFGELLVEVGLLVGGFGIFLQQRLALFAQVLHGRLGLLLIGYLAGFLYLVVLAVYPLLYVGEALVQVGGLVFHLGQPGLQLGGDLFVAGRQRLEAGLAGGAPGGRRGGLGGRLGRGYPGLGRRGGFGGSGGDRSGNRDRHGGGRRA